MTELVGTVQDIERKRIDETIHLRQISEKA